MLGPMRGDKVARGGAEVHAERLDGRPRDARGRAAPARVGGGHGPRPRVGQEDGHAVGHLHAEGDPRMVAGRDVRGVPVRVAAGSPATPDNHDSRAVHLAKANDGVGREAQGERDAMPAVSGRGRPGPEHGCRVVKQWSAGASGRQRMAGPHGNRAHSNVRRSDSGILETYDDYRHRPRRHRHPAHRGGHRAYGDRFTHRVFTEAEIAYCASKHNPAPHYAGRFSAKEAAMKALGTGLRACCGATSRWSAAAGRPRLQSTAGRSGSSRRSAPPASLLTITHADTVAMAQVLILRADCGGNSRSHPAGAARAQRPCQRQPGPASPFPFSFANGLQPARHRLALLGRCRGPASARCFSRPGPRPLPARDAPSRRAAGARHGSSRGAHHARQVLTQRPGQPSRQTGRRRTALRRWPARRPQAHRVRHLGAPERQRPERDVSGSPSTR